MICYFFIGCGCHYNIGMLYRMSVYFSQPRTAYDEEQAYQRHLAYLKTQSETSQKFQDAYRSELLGVPPTPPQVMTATEVLENQLELDKAAQKYLRMLVPDAVRPPPYDATKEDMRIFLKRTQPAKYIFENLGNAQKQLLVQNFPAIQTELKNYQFIDADFLLEYLDKYAAAYESTGGVARFGKMSIARGEIAGIVDQIPTRDQMTRLAEALNRAIQSSSQGIKVSFGKRVADLLKRMETITSRLPTKDELAATLDSAVQLGQESIMEGNYMTDIGPIQELTQSIERLPTAAYIQDIERTVARTSDVAAMQAQLERLEEIVTGMPTSLLMNIDGALARLRQETIEQLGETKTAPKKGRPTKGPPTEPTTLVPTEKERAQKEFSESQQLQPSPEETGGLGFGRGVMVKHKIQKKFSTIVGRGLSLKEDEPSYVEFGKFALSKNHLNKGQLCIRSLKSGAYVHSIPTCEVSEDFVDILENFLQTEKLNERALKRLDKKEKQLISTLLNKSGLYGKYKIKVAKTEEEIAEEERFNLVKGEIIAGNDNPELIKELKRFIMKFVIEGRIPKREANELLFQLTFI